MKDYQPKNIIQLDDNIVNRIIALAESAATNEDEDTLNAFREAVSQARGTKTDLNEEYRQIHDGTLDMPPHLLKRMLSNDPSGRKIWQLEYELNSLIRFMRQLSFSLNYQDMGALAKQGYDMHRKLEVVYDLLLSEIKMFRQHVEMPSGYMPRWNYEVQNGCILCPCESGHGIVICLHCIENKPCEAV